MGGEVVTWLRFCHSGLMMGEKFKGVEEFKSWPMEGAAWRSDGQLQAGINGLWVSAETAILEEVC